MIINTQIIKQYKGSGLGIQKTNTVRSKTTMNRKKSDKKEQYRIIGGAKIQKIKKNIKIIEQLYYKTEINFKNTKMRD